MLPAELELDLDVFSGPFDLLLALVLREEVDLLELPLYEVVLAYIDHLEARGELDLEAATEFIVLVAALAELKSRLLLGGEPEEDGELEPGEAAEELLARMLEARRYRAAATYLQEQLEAQPQVRYREAPLPIQLRRASLAEVEGALWDPAILGEAIEGLLKRPAAIDVSHLGMPRVTLAERLTHLRELLRRGGALEFETAVRGADRLTVAMTLYALLELHKLGEASFRQSKCFGEITVKAAA